MVTRPRSSVFADRRKERFASAHTLVNARVYEKVRTHAKCASFMYACDAPRPHTLKLSACTFVERAMIPTMRADVHVHFAHWQVPSDEIMQLYLRVRSISFGTRSEDR